MFTYNNNNNNGHFQVLFLRRAHCPFIKNWCEHRLMKIHFHIGSILEYDIYNII